MERRWACSESLTSDDERCTSDGPAIRYLGSREVRNNQCQDSYIGYRQHLRAGLHQIRRRPKNMCRSQCQSSLKLEDGRYFGKTSRNMDPQKDASAAEPLSEVMPDTRHIASNAGCASRSSSCRPTRAKRESTGPGSARSEEIPQSHKCLHGKEEMS